MVLRRFWPCCVAALLISSGCSAADAPQDVQATVQARVEATLAALPSPTAVPPTPQPTVTAAPTWVPALSETDIAARGRTWLAHVERGKSAGSGIVVTPDGYVLTNEHVVHDSGPIRVALADGRSLYGDLVGVDAEVDLALLQVSADGLPAATFGDPALLKQADPLIVLGYALDLPGEPTITRGVFSGRRALDNRVSLIQTDAAMNPGVSGGAMLDRTGAVVAVNVARLEAPFGGPAVQGMNLGIPADTALSFVRAARAGQLRPPAPPETPTPLPAPTPSQRGTLVVNKRYGAALRASASSDSRVLVMMDCGASLDVIGAQTGDGWFPVRWGGLEGWVGGLRVTSGPAPDAGACAGAPYPPYVVGETLYASVQSGCLSIRPTPSANAAIAGCVPSGHPFQLTNGPIEVSGEDWYGVRSQASGLSGWTRAAYLIR